MGGDDGEKNAGGDPAGRYRPHHGDPGGILPACEGPTPEGAGDARARGFPTVQELADLNRRIHEDDNHPERFRLYQPALLRSCLIRAAAVDTSTPEGVMRAAAQLGHGIAQAQAFRDGNRRTAYFATQAFLHKRLRVHQLTLQARHRQE